MPRLISPLAAALLFAGCCSTLIAAAEPAQDEREEVSTEQVEDSDRATVEQELPAPSVAGLQDARDQPRVNQDRRLTVRQKRIFVLGLAEKENK